MEGRGARRPPWGAIGVFLILVVLHLAFRPGARLLFGWLPAELAWRIAYCVLAWGFLVWISLRVWREEPDP